MRTPDEVLTEVARRLDRRWSHVVTGEPWAGDFRLGSSSLSGRRLAEAWARVQPIALGWSDWLDTAGEGVELERRSAGMHGTQQPLPSLLRLADIDVAARIVGAGWPELLASARARAAALSTAFPAYDDPAGLLRATRDLSDVDFDLLLRTARWFADPHPSGLTARQVPVIGLGTKWLDRRAGLVRRLAGLDALDLVPGRPSRIHLTYLDPDHLAAGGRRHDVATVGDVDTLAYRPDVVVISENRDTAQQFPPVRGGIAIEGDGNGPGAVPHLLWVQDCPDVVYWGDMDVKGLEILAAYRAIRPALHLRSMFMDLASYERWERFGVDHDHDGRPLRERPAKQLRLEPGEHDLYTSLCSPDWTRHRRIEQERIPLEDAAAVVRGG